SDIYSLGATLYVLLTGQAPFREGDAGDLLQKVRNGDFLPPSRIKNEVPASLEAICLKAMATQPCDRYPAANVLAADIEHWLADEPVAAYRESLAATVGRWVRKHRTGVIAAGAAMAVAVVGLAASTWLLTTAYRQAEDQRDQARAQRDRARDYLRM